MKNSINSYNHFPLPQIQNTTQVTVFSSSRRRTPPSHILKDEDFYMESSSLLVSLPVLCFAYSNRWWLVVTTKFSNGFGIQMNAIPIFIYERVCIRGNTARWLYHFATTKLCVPSLCIGLFFTAMTAIGVVRLWAPKAPKKRIHIRNVFFGLCTRFTEKAKQA